MIYNYNKCLYFYFKINYNWRKCGY